MTLPKMSKSLIRMKMVEVLHFLISTMMERLILPMVTGMVLTGFTCKRMTMERQNSGILQWEVIMKLPHQSGL